jgi:hypothetical protein
MAINPDNKGESKDFAQAKIDEATVNHLNSFGPVPTVAAGAAAGASPTVAIVGSDVAGQLNITTGTTTTTNAILATITFGTAMKAPPKAVIITPNNAATKGLAVALTPYVGSANSTAAVWVITSGPTAIGDSTAFSWNYVVIG